MNPTLPTDLHREHYRALSPCGRGLLSHLDT